MKDDDWMRQAARRGANGIAEQRQGAAEEAGAAPQITTTLVLSHSS